MKATATRLGSEMQARRAAGAARRALSLLLLLLLLTGLTGIALATPPPADAEEAHPAAGSREFPEPLSPNAGRRREGSLEDEEPLDSPAAYAECCGQAAERRCQRACLTALEGARLTFSKLLDAVQGAGCEILVHDPLFLCFMTQSHDRQDSSSLSSPVVLDVARLHCCDLARAAPCRRACQSAFRDDWTVAGRGGPLQECLNRPNETALSSCLAEVDAPCRPSDRCSGLDFCSGMSLAVQADRADPGSAPWFRSCSAVADLAASRTVQQWQQGQGLHGVPGVPGVPLLRGARGCGGGLWRALACLLHAQPCHPAEGSLPLCLEDCQRILPRCVQWSAVPPGFSADQLCARIAGPPPCVRLPGLDWGPDEDDIRLPEGTVEPEVPPATPTEVSPGSSSGTCLLGPASDVRVSEGTVVRVPRRGVSACYAACLCEAGSVARCVNLPCPQHGSVCALSATTVDHRRTVFLDCLVCSCSSGDTLCTQRTSGTSGTCPAASAAPASPCGCPQHHVPVCGRNGRTYRNACVSRCAGLGERDVRPGPCPSLDPCARSKATSPCGAPGQGCLPDRRLCLSLLVETCPQHQCVNVLAACESQPTQPVCDTAGLTHRNPCAMLRASRQLLHRGPCLIATGASRASRGPVCGMDGLTYSSWASAWESRVAVDYASECVDHCAHDTRCPELPAGCLRGVRAVGACCETCAAVLRATLNTKALDRAVLAIRKNPWPRMHASFSLHDLLQQLQQEVLEDCWVQGHLVHSDQLVIVVATATDARAAAAGAASLLRCYREAERLAGLFHQSAASTQSSLLLSAVQAVDLHPAPQLAPGPAPGGAVSLSHLSVVLSTCVLLVYTSLRLFDVQLKLFHFLLLCSLLFSYNCCCC